MDCYVDRKHENRFEDQRPEQHDCSDPPGSGPKPSCVSCKSNHSKGIIIEFNDGHPSSSKTPEQQDYSDPPGSGPKPSCVSCKSNHSKGIIIEFNDGQPSSSKTRKLEHFPESSEGPRDQLDPIFQTLEERIVTYVKSEVKKMQNVLSYQECVEMETEEDEDEEPSCREAFLEIALLFLRKMKHVDLADCLQSKSRAAVCQRKHKAALKEKFHCVFEGVAKAGEPTLLNNIYTELYITEGGAAEVNDEHEVRRIETAFRKSEPAESTMRPEDVFKGSAEAVRTVMTKGVAGIGKTVLTQKFTLDWAEDKTHHEIQFMFPFTFRELNVLREKKFSLVELVHHFFSETKDAGICSFHHFQVVFIFDGLDECRLPLDFHNNRTLTDVTESTSVDVLLTNLIKGNLLPSAHIWITTRPAAANQIPPGCVHKMTEVRGFSDPQKEEYFRKRFREEEQAEGIVSHIRTSRSLHIMCHIPVFCWITATVLQEVLKNKRGRQLPKTLTEMYIHFLVVQTTLKKIKYDGGDETDPHWSPESRKMIVSLGKLAFEQLQKGNLIFYESDLTECGINVRAASVYSGVLTQIFKEERGLYRDRVFCFIHLSVQEFLAALHVHLNFLNSGVNLLEDDQAGSWWSGMTEDRSEETDIYRSAVDKALKRPDGHLDLFLRFLLGLSLPSNQTLLPGLLRLTGNSSQTNQDTVQYIKKKINENQSAERSINLFHCLNELNDSSLVEDIQQSLKSGSLSPDRLSSAQWSALAFIMVSSEQNLDLFDLKKYSASEEALLRLLPVVKASTTALLGLCNLSDRSCGALASVLSSPSCSLRVLDLSNNNLQDSGVKLLSSGLQSPHCKLETLRLSLCNLSEKSCRALASVLSSSSCSLRVLDLSNNDLEDSGVMLLSSGLQSPHCRLETLSLSGCMITEDGCASLVSALNSNPSHMRDLDLSYNHPGASQLKLLSDKVQDPQCGLQTLKVDRVGVRWVRPGLKKYFCQLTIDTNTVNRKLQLSDDNRMMTHVTQDQAYPDHPDRFDYCRQLLCSNSLTGRSYWEVEWSGRAHVSVCYRGIKRKGDSDACELGYNERSWSLFCSEGIYSVYHNNKGTSVRLHALPSAPSASSSPSSSSSGSNKIAVYLDHAAGSLTFYKVVSDTLIHIHTFNATFTEPLHPGFGVGFRPGCSVRLCPM